ncbi:ion transporter [Microbacterium sulfonylureivorans]|uniref:ion transporter n=1 Tax=Microbacterium sulfonylureivorans TaxID=2486854 RepID=UPI000FDB2520|nr:ion transporter [Microbacterium sulfonylureivorans]
MSAPRTELKSTGYEIFIGLLSVLSILNLILVYAVVSDPGLQQILNVMNLLFSGIFLGDFTYRISTAPSAGAYFFKHFGWADLLASLPFPQAKILRVFRLVRVARLLRDVGPRTIWRSITRDRAGSALLLLLLMGILVLEFGSLAILKVEEYAEGANITSASDALWYTIVTISTVGYGDQYPVTEAGRFIGTGIIIIGVGIFGTFTGYLANLFLSPRKGDDSAAATSTTDAPAPVDATTDVASAAGEKASAAPVGSGAQPAGSAATLDDLRTLLARSEASLAEVKVLLGGGSDAADAAPA